MVETKDQDYWNELSKKGQAEQEIIKVIEELKNQFLQEDPNEIFISNSDNFRSTFSKKLENILDETIDKYFSSIPLNVKTQKKNKFLSEIHEYLVTIHLKKVQGKISFEAYSILNFVQALDKIVSEAQFKIDEQGLVIELMDPSRICLIRIVLSNPTYQFYTQGSHCLNVEDFKLMLSCEKNDRSATSLEFAEEKLLISIHSKKYDGDIDRTLHYLSLTLEDIPLDNLRSINYPFEFGIERDKFIYTKKNIGKHGEIIEITANNSDSKRAVRFSDAGQIGNGGVNWKREALAHFTFNQSQIEKELESGEGEQTMEVIHQILSEQTCISMHSFQFIIWLEKLATLLEKGDTVNFWIRTDHPMKVMMDFKKLGDCSLEYYLAPRNIREGEEEEEEDF
jgi:hypothetical protein